VGHHVQRRAEPVSGSLFHYEFVRIGEDYEDIVKDCSNLCDHILGVERKGLYKHMKTNNKTLWRVTHEQETVA
jgi:hypothetical protein